ncbi:MAG: hypothetical protein V4507_07500, partial [Verrucomicrobiota bacterium]
MFLFHLIKMKRVKFAKYLLAFFFIIGSNLAMFAGEFDKIIGGYFVTEKWGREKLLPEKINFKTYNFIYQAFLKAKVDGSLVLDPDYCPFP